jgi:uncharacterized protein YprB with RNaseH-like and TPR domain
MVAPDRDRLRSAFRLGRKDGAPGPASAPAADAPVDAALDATMPRADLRSFLQRRLAGPPRAVVALPQGIEEQGRHGGYWRRELRYSLQHQHGETALGSALCIDRAHVAKLAKAPEFAAIEPQQFLFLDTETTGLHGGAGTTVFAFGLAFFTAEELVLEQLFLRDYGEEAAMLDHVARRLAERPVPVTYVGKTFDRHRIAARMAVHKMPTPILQGPHLDLYHVARRLYGKQFPDCRLRTIEQRVLGLVRHDDLPGSEAPVAFLSWLRDRTGPVDRVLEHNRLDVLSVVALLGTIGTEKSDSGAAKTRY